MIKNTEISFEVLIQLLFEEILSQEVVDNIDVQHNIILKYKDIEHHIDLYWEFECGGIKYVSILHAKDLKTSPLNKEELLEFKSILNNLPGQPRGIIITNKGYPNEVKEFAEKNDILIYVLKVLTDKNLKDTTRNIEVNMSIHFPDIQDYNLELDQEWIKTEKYKSGISDDIIINLNLSSESIFYDENDNEVLTVNELIKSYISKDNKLNPTRIAHKFDNPCFIKTGNPEFPKLKVKKLKFTISAKKRTGKIVLKRENIIGFILKNMLENRGNVFDKQNKITA